MSSKKLNGIVWLVITTLLIGFLVYVVAAGLPWFKGKYILDAKSAIRYGLDLKGGVTITYMPEGNMVPSQEQLITVRDIMRKRLDSKNYLDANVTTSQSNRVIVEIPNLKDPQEAVKELGQTALLELIDPQGQPCQPGQYLEGGQVVLSGMEVTDARAIAEPNSNNWRIDFSITSEAQKKFAEATGRLAPEHGVIAITLDRVVISAPRVESRIDSSSANITGDFNKESAEELAHLIKSGALPFKLKPVTTEYVGASLGQGALDISIKAGIIGFLLVTLFMILWYRAPGLAASGALIAYIATLIFIFARSKITLTLPGIAGIILSIGVAVDANIIIFERLKEELRGGKTLRAGLDAAFSRAWPAIRDANITTIISSAVLFYFGTGPIKGFAITLGIGVIISMISAILLTRFILNQFYKVGIENKKLYYKEEKA